jgi:hypothetical protein
LEGSCEVEDLPNSQEIVGFLQEMIDASLSRAVHFAGRPVETHLIVQKTGELTAMTTRRKKAVAAFTAMLAFSLSQVYVQAGLPNADPGAPPPQRAITAKLATKNNQPISLNGNSAGTGATILTGATIETPDQVSATIDLGDAGTIEVQPNSKIQLEFDADGNVRVKQIKGCTVVRKKQSALPGEIEIYTDSATEKTNKNRKHMGFCYLPSGQLGAVTGAAAGAGLSTTTTVLIVGAVTGGIVTGVALARGGNNSPSR